MPANFTNTWGQDDWSKTISESLIRQSALLAASEPMEVTGKVFHKPRLSVHPTAEWVGELETLPTDAGTEDVIAFTPQKIGNSTLISLESIEDASVSVLNKLGQGMARGLSRTIDTTALSANAATATTPAGLLHGLTANNPEAGAAGAFSLDDILNGISAIETVGGNADVAFVNGADLNALRKLKSTTNEYLWMRGASVVGDPAAKPVDTFAGVMFLVSPGIAAGTLLIADSDYISVVSNRLIDVEFSAEAAFLNDAIAAKCTARFDWAIEDDNAVYLLQTTAG